jgi:acyl-CoA synthetase (NDP forming)
VAVIGASADPTKWGGQILNNMISGWYPGRVYPVNPKGGPIFGLPAYPSVARLPETPDLALVAVPAQYVPDVVKDCAQAGVRAAVVISSGFSEVGAEGAALEDRVADAAADAGMAMIGPNCMGVMSSWSRLYATGAIIMHPAVGPGSFISQSGNMGIHLWPRRERRHRKFGYWERPCSTPLTVRVLSAPTQTGVILAHRGSTTVGVQWHARLR